MYCIKCGVKLSDTEKSCPLCGTVPYHPDLARTQADSLYPKNKYPKTKKVSRMGIMMAVTVVSILPILITVLCDLQVYGTVSWSGYVLGAIVTVYSSFVMPFWFKKPNPVIFTPLFFALSGVYLLYINYVNNGDWFLSFAFPNVLAVGLIVTALVTLTRYLRKGRLFVYGGAFILLGAYMPLMELFLTITFDVRFIWWSLYPMITLVLLGLLLIFFGITPSARENVERRFFI